MALYIVIMAAKRESRELTAGEQAALSDGLASALAEAHVRPRIAPRALWIGYVARLWRGSLPIMAVGRTVYWPGAPDDLSAPGRERQMAVLQHELQHLLDYATGALTPIGYALWPANWVYRYRLTRTLDWRDLGAEQRAQAVQDYWLAERGLLPDGPAAAELRRLIPWATPSRRGRVGKPLSDP